MTLSRKASLSDQACTSSKPCATSHVYHDYTQADVAFWTSLVQYLNNVGDAADGLHNAIGSFYMWAWDANADDTFHSGGLVASDWETLNWQKLGALIGNNTEFTYGLDLIPWYLPGYVLPTGNDAALRCFQA